MGVLWQEKEGNTLEAAFAVREVTGHPVSVQRQEQGAAGSSTTSCDRDRVRDVQGGTWESTWGWEHRDVVTRAEVPVTPTMPPCTQSSSLTHTAELGDNIFLYPSMLSPKSIVPHLVHHEAQPQQPLHYPKLSCPVQTGTGVVAVVTAPPQTAWTGGHGQHWLHKGDCSTAPSPQLAPPRGTRCGAEQPQGPLLTWGSPSRAGDIGTKRLCKGAGDTAEAKNPANSRWRGGPAASWLHPTSPCRGPRAIQPFSLPPAPRPHGKRIKVHDKPGQDQHRAAQPRTGSVPPAPAPWGNTRLLSPLPITVTDGTHAPEGRGTRVPILPSADCAAPARDSR